MRPAAVAMALLLASASAGCLSVERPSDDVETASLPLDDPVRDDPALEDPEAAPAAADAREGGPAAGEAGSASNASAASAGTTSDTSTASPSGPSETSAPGPDANATGPAGSDAASGNATSSSGDPAAGNVTGSRGGNATSGAGAAGSSGTKAASGPKVAHARFEFDAQLTGATLFGAGATSTCLRIEGNATLTRGNATATWSSGAVGADELVLVFDHDGRTTATGGSPLVLDLPQTLLGDGNETIVSLGFSDDSTAVQQEVHVEVAFDYVGSKPVFRTRSC